MSKSQSNRISKVLRLIADCLENNPDFLKQLEDFLNNTKLDKLETQSFKLPDIWTIQSKEGNAKLKAELEKLSIPQLIKIIQLNAFDSTKLSHKWKNKEKLITLIIERVSDRVNKGKIFYEFGKPKDETSQEENESKAEINPPSSTSSNIEKVDVAKSEDEEQQIQ